LQAALGYDIAQSLFADLKPYCRGVTDFWYLSTISDLTSAGRKGLNSKIIITLPVGQACSYMVSLLSSQNLNVVVLLDDENKAVRLSVELQQQGMLNRKNVFVWLC
jgi:hypothetical protein